MALLTSQLEFLRGHLVEVVASLLLLYLLPKLISSALQQWRIHRAFKPIPCIPALSPGTWTKVITLIVLDSVYSYMASSISGFSCGLGRGGEGIDLIHVHWGQSMGVRGRLFRVVYLWGWDRGDTTRYGFSH